jgi:hypothetical protein
MIFFYTNKKALLGVGLHLEALRCILILFSLFSLFPGSLGLTDVMVISG